jgi:hypothetical protein
MARSRRTRRPLLLFALGTLLLLSGARPALGQLGYTGVPAASPPPDVYVGDPYVGPYVVASPGVAPPAGADVRSPGPAPSAAPAALSVSDAALTDRPPDMVKGDRRLVTGWDVASIAALGLIAVAGLSASAGRLRSR